MRGLRAALLVLAALLLSATPAFAASTTIDEPNYTKPVAQPDITGNPAGNTWWFRFTQEDRPTRGAPGNCSGYGYTTAGETCPRYRYCLWYRNTTASSYTFAACPYPPTNLQPLSQNPNAFFNPRLSLANIPSGQQWEACIQSQFYAYDGSGVGAGWTALHTAQCEATRIDSGAPSTTVTINEGAASTNDPNLRLRITYSDGVSPAWPATFLCKGDPCSSLSSFTYDAACSNYPGSGSSCTRTHGGADGTIRWCASVADGAVRDEPTGTNQFANPFANFANLSTISCDTIVLDRLSGTAGGDPGAGDT